MPDREKVKAELDGIVEQCRGMDYIGFSTITEHCQNILALLKEYEQSEQSYLRTLVELSNERDKLLKELGREDEHKYKDGSFMAGGNGIVKL